MVYIRFLLLNTFQVRLEWTSGISEETHGLFLWISGTETAIMSWRLNAARADYSLRKSSWFFLFSEKFWFAFCKLFWAVPVST